MAASGSKAAMRHALLAGWLAMLVTASAGAESGRSLTLASTTSTQASGLFDHLIPRFRAQTGIDVHVVAVGTGQAFEIGRRGDADALLVHDTDAERAFVEQGHGVERADVMYNDFVLVGPASDPAHIAEAATATQALRRIADHQAAFASRGDDSGTHRAELDLWSSAGLPEPVGSWYRELGSGMGATLNTAAGMNAYTMTDRASWIAFDNRQELALLFEGDEALFNQYGSLLANPKHHPHLDHELAEQWHRWLISDAGQRAIASYRLRAQQLFFPNAD